MITFSRNDNKVIVKVEHGIFHGDQYFELDILQNYQYQAQLLRNALELNLSRKLEEIRKEAYEQGWKDAKAKRKKQTWFSGWWK